ncbi:MAG: hypothetical protein GY775_06410 [Candidatus Scalindua sp.]|nr:hypothetical protein [Candidatus Scalindua sp.]
MEEFVSKQIINENGIIVLQHHKKQKIIQECFKQLNIIDERQYSNTQLTFLKENVAARLNDEVGQATKLDES